jgi:hypothetical protein
VASASHEAAGSRAAIVRELLLAPGCTATKTTASAKTTAPTTAGSVLAGLLVHLPAPRVVSAITVRTDTPQQRPKNMQSLGAGEEALLVKPAFTFCLHDGPEIVTGRRSGAGYGRASRPV